MSLDQRWDFRKKSDENDSSSEESTDIVGRKKHTLVSNLISSDNGEDYDNLRSVEKSPLDSNLNLPNPPQKDPESSRKKVVIKRKNMKRKKTRVVQENNRMMDDLKAFADSMIAEIKDAREKMFAEMKEEMAKILANESPKRNKNKVKNNPRIKIKTSKKTQDLSGVTIEPNGKLKLAEPELNRGAVQLIEKEKSESPFSLIQKAMNSNSSYLTLPSVLSRPQMLHQRTGLYSRNSILPPGFSIGSSSSNPEIGNSMFNANNHHGYYMNLHPDEHFVPYNSKDYSTFFNKQSTQTVQNSQTSLMGATFAVPIHQGPDGTISIPALSQESLEDRSRMLMRMNGGSIKFPQGSNNGLTERFVTNSLSNRLNYQGDGSVKPMKSEDRSNGHFP